MILDNMIYRMTYDNMLSQLMTFAFNMTILRNYFLNKFHIIAFFTGRYPIKMQDGRIYRFIS